MSLLVGSWLNRWVWLCLVRKIWFELNVTVQEEGITALEDKIVMEKGPEFVEGS